MKNILQFLRLGVWVLALVAWPVSAQKIIGVTPANLAGGVPTDTTVAFTFDTDMDPIQDFTWYATSGSLPSALTDFSYAWTTPRKLVATKATPFPANATIIWTANTAGFSDVVGFPLDSNGMNSGIFMTGSGGGGGGADGTGTALVSLTKFANYDQFSAADPVLTTNFIYYFGAVASAPRSRGLTNVSLMIPGGAVSNLFTTPFAPTNFFLAVATNVLAPLETQFPPGAYAFALMGPSSNQTVAVALPATALPAAPKFSNFTAGQTVDPAAAFTLQFAAGGVASEPVYLKILAQGSSAYVFESPDLAQPGHLNGTSNSVALPAGTFQADKTYEVELGRWIVGTNLVGGNSAAVSIGSVTRTVLKTTGGTATQIQLKNPTFTGGFFSVEATLAANQSYSLERSTDTTTWDTFSPVFAVGTSQTFFDYTPTNSHAIYRVKRN